jgi:hypothetical protein
MTIVNDDWAWYFSQDLGFSAFSPKTPLILFGELAFGILLAAGAGAEGIFQ